MTIRVGINGFGRIGRQVVRAAAEQGVADIEFVAVNDLTDTKTLAHLFKYDSVHGTYEGDVSAASDGVHIDGRKLTVLSEKDPAALPWKKLGADLVLESTGRFTDRDSAKKHLDAGAKKVVISAPAKGEDITIVMGVNHEKYDAAKHTIISNASCTTNCLVPMVKVIRDAFGFKHGSMTTIHSYTNDQNVLDFPHKDLRRARAAAISMIPTTTGAAKAVALVLPEVKGKLSGMAFRVPTPTVSVVDLTFKTEKATSLKEINAALKKASETYLKGILGYTDEEVVSSDFIHEKISSVYDAGSSIELNPNFFKLISWYDNEWGYSNRCVDLLTYMVKKSA